MTETSKSGPDNEHILVSVLWCILCVQRIAFLRTYWTRVYMCFVVTCWERADLLALVCGVCCEFVTFPLVSWVRCGTWLYPFLIFAPLLTLMEAFIYKIWKRTDYNDVRETCRGGHFMAFLLIVRQKKLYSNLNESLMEAIHIWNLEEIRLNMTKLEWPRQRVDKRKDGQAETIKIMFCSLVCW